MLCASRRGACGERRLQVPMRLARRAAWWISDSRARTHLANRTNLPGVAPDRAGDDYAWAWPRGSSSMWIVTWSPGSGPSPPCCRPHHCRDAHCADRQRPLLSRARPDRCGRVHNPPAGDRRGHRPGLLSLRSSPLALVLSARPMRSRRLPAGEASPRTHRAATTARLTLVARIAHGATPPGDGTTTRTVLEHLGAVRAAQLSLELPGVWRRE